MKKILAGVVCAAAVLAFTSCGTTKEAGAAGTAAAAGTGGDIPPALCMYTFEQPIEDGDIPDASGNELLGYAGGDGTLTDGKFGKAMVLNGSDCYVSLDESVFNSDEFTFAAWVKPDMWKDWARILDIGDGASSDMWLGYAGWNISSGWTCSDRRAQLLRCLLQLPQPDSGRTLPLRSEAERQVCT